MQFVDHAKIVMKAGNGGDGHASFHREKYVAQGGPDGGDGGRGGDVVFFADPHLSTLLDFKFQRFYRAENGAPGQAALSSGKNGKPLIIHVPIGTIVRDVESGAILADLSEGGKERVVLHGGRGGKGNAKFATSTRQAPRFAQPGQKTLEYEVELELKSIADVGLVGLPSVGKSTILSVLTAAKPKIAAYHFTTLSPNLGVASRHNRSFVLADIPGLIEGAAEGAGLGHDFLRHIERTRMLVHVLDISGSEMRDPIEDYEKINDELKKFSPLLTEIPQLVAANKTDLPEAEENLARFKEEYPNVEVFPVSAATVQGFEALLDRVVQVLDTLPPVLRYEETDLVEGSAYEPGFHITRGDDGVFEVTGGDVEKLLDTTDPDDEISMRRFQQLLVKNGIISALREMGAKDGDGIRLGEWEFDFME
ncbi:MAG: GTPase ObgE [Eubacteriales bacterium]|nr:GTPase ObgE [Eubacteriales bacterium]